MSGTPFMPLWVADFVGDTLDLDAKEIGAFMLILMALWTRGGTLPNDTKKLQRVARIGRDWPKVWATIGHYFIAENGSISNRRLTLELHKVDTKRRVNAHSGARGGRAKALKYNKPALANAVANALATITIPIKKEERTAIAVQKNSRKRGTRLPENWQLPKPYGDWAIAEGWPIETIRLEADKFRDYWIAKSGNTATKIKWLPTWRNWMRNVSVQKSGGQNAAPRQNGYLDAFLGSPDVDQGQDRNPAQPLLSGKRRPATG